MFSAPSKSEAKERAPEVLPPVSYPAILIVTGPHQAVPWASRPGPAGSHGHHSHFSWRKGVGTPQGTVGFTHFSKPQFV